MTAHLLLALLSLIGSHIHITCTKKRGYNTRVFLFRAGEIPLLQNNKKNALQPHQKTGFSVPAIHLADLL
jgi:hypothetical protein